MDEGSKAHGQEYMVTLERFHSVFGAAKHIKVSDDIQILILRHQTLVLLWHYGAILCNRGDVKHLKL